MTEGVRTAERPSPELKRIALASFGVSFDDSEDAWRGEESVGWKGSSMDGARFVQRLPPWREVDELAWCDELAKAASTVAPACVHAIPLSDARVVVPSSEDPVTVFPFVVGAHPMADDDILLPAARLLAAMHRSIAGAWSAAKKPSRTAIPRSVNLRSDLLADDDLDRWERSDRQEVPMHPIHGDYYGGNLLVQDAQIEGVIDWSEADIAPREQEVAWATWEFCHSESDDALIESRAEEFLQAYIESDGPAQVASPFDPIPWIRSRLRKEARAWFSDPRSEVEHSDYHEAQLAALQGLRARRLQGR